MAPALEYGKCGVRVCPDMGQLALIWWGQGSLRHDDVVVGVSCAARFFQHHTIVCRLDTDNLGVEVNVFWADFACYCVNVLLPILQSATSL